MALEKDLRSLVADLHSLSKDNKKDSEETQSEKFKEYFDGKSAAYELSAKFLEELLDKEFKISNVD